MMLVLYGEDRAGNEATRLFVATLSGMPGLPRRYRPMEHQIANIMHSRMRPLFAYREQMATPRLNEYQARKLAREQAGKALNQLGMTEQTLPPYAPPPGTYDN